MFKTWRIRTQILVTQLITMIVSVTILGLCLFLNFEGIFQALSNDAEKKFIMNFIYRQTNSQLNAYTRNLENRIRQGIYAINDINLLNQQIYNTSMTFAQNSDRCLQESYLNGSFVLKCQYCYGVFDCSNQVHTPEQYSQEFLQLSNLLTSLIPMQIQLDMYFTSISKDCYFSTYPGQPFGDYVPSSRSWFQNHMANNLILIILEVSTYLVRLTWIVVVDLNFSDIHQFMEEDQQMLAMDSKGRILIKVYYLYNQSIFGFDQSDVNLILNHSSGQNEQACEIQIPQTICIENKNTGVLWYFRVKRMTGDYYVLSMFNQSAYSNYFSTLRTTLSKIYAEIVTEFVLGLLSIILSCFCIYIGCFVILQKPIDKLINSFNKYLLYVDHHDQLDKLSQAFIRIMTRSMSNKENRKRTVDQYMSQSQYPINFYVNSKIMNAQTKLLLQVNFQI
ncbi:unnamed protein product (macronuclear) [Paramecium tetraurelia]|uniref:Transmembrane protein n=1 Tax=Paramecium tetraurelia TaxID=5888 RepID=A0DWC0_PARTE|nr:uncharacterized protein GSPATT00020979001 [Paramecium tetraurelia]CAK87337.1 unnamed protein product [Paramecium tetraurelia]|eukprot:XP_001454734.1 hypothetical protein (macronuclear) [Paramecium tetraurelia strain d4-2]